MFCCGAQETTDARIEAWAASATTASAESAPVDLDKLGLKPHELEVVIAAAGGRARRFAIASDVAGGRAPAIGNTAILIRQTLRSQLSQFGASRAVGLVWRRRSAGLPPAACERQGDGPRARAVRERARPLARPRLPPPDRAPRAPPRQGDLKFRASDVCVARRDLSISSHATAQSHEPSMPLIERWRGASGCVSPLATAKRVTNHPRPPPHVHLPPPHVGVRTSSRGFRGRSGGE